MYVAGSWIDLCTDGIFTEELNASEWVAISSDGVFMWYEEVVPSSSTGVRKRVCVKIKTKEKIGYFY